MSINITKARAAFNEQITQLGRPDLTTEQGRLDYQKLLLAQNNLALLDLPELNPDAAVFLYHLVETRLRELMTMALLTQQQGQILLYATRVLYGRTRPELLSRLQPTQEAAPDA